VLLPVVPNGGGPRSSPAAGRGAELESAILDAAWQLFLEDGYPLVTIAAVAQRAGTSKPVLYRRWQDRDDLLRDAIGHVVEAMDLEAPDTGSLRGDTLALMEAINTSLVGLTAVLSVHLAGWYQATGTSPSDVRAGLVSDVSTAVEVVASRAIERGEVDPARLTPRMFSMPYDLMRAEAITTLQHVPHEVLEEIVDTMFLPLVLSPEHRRTSPAHSARPRDETHAEPDN
jgi:AcrR family transcriptional regulator